MAVLRTALLSFIASCGTPDFRECAVACTSREDCATEHVCGDRGLCARPETTCGFDPPSDGAPGVVDAPREPDDAPQPSDAQPADGPPATGVLRIKIKDQGRVEVSGLGVCNWVIADQCDFAVELGVQRTLTAIPHPIRVFERWEKACTGTQSTCVLVPTTPFTEVEAKFRKDNDDDDDD